MSVNVSNVPELSEVFDLLSQPSRLNIFLAIGRAHVCVCHLESMLEMRQAAISQQLMILRSAGLVKTERRGRHIYYHLSDLRWLDWIEQAALFLNMEIPKFELPEIEGCDYAPAVTNTST